MSNNVTGLVVYNGASLINGAPIVAILTLQSKNAKTGNMAQLWILPTLADPVQSIRLGLDDAVCGGCPHRGEHAGKGRSCYVNVSHAPLSIFRAYKSGRYIDDTADLSHAEYALAGRKVRLGAYGDPAALPKHVIRTLAEAADGHTAYTHQWQDGRRQWLKAYAMASCDTPEEQQLAKLKGWRAFTVTPDATACATSTDIVCPSESHGVKCSKCTLCDGKPHDGDTRKSITITVHGSGAGHYRNR